MRASHLNRSEDAAGGFPPSSLPRSLLKQGADRGAVTVTAPLCSAANNLSAFVLAQTTDASERMFLQPVDQTANPAGSGGSLGFPCGDIHVCELAGMARG